MTKSKMTFLKRQKERDRQAKKLEKEERKQRRSERSADNTAPGEDPDLAGIVPGPQPPADWQLS